MGTIFAKLYISDRVNPRFFDQVGHETMYASTLKSLINEYSLKTKNTT